MTFVFTKISHTLALSGLGSLAEAGVDLRVALVMGLNSAVAERHTAEFMGDLFLNEFDGAGYSRLSLSSQVLFLNAAEKRTELTAAVTEWATLGVGFGDAVGALVFKFVTDDSDSPVVAYYDDGDFPKPGTGSIFKITWPSTGLLQFVCPQ